jgi:pyrimidine-nucleoside phosphorylase
MLPQWIIEKKRDGHPLTDQEITTFIEDYTHDTIPDYQMSALAMAIYFQGMTPAETGALTLAMMNSGQIIDPASLPGVKVDKHSTGGIGDKISLPLAPLVAACGVTVPMIAGRGLGITGGTIDKLESIPGYRTDLTIPEFTHVLQTCGCSINAQTPTLAPADKKLYALRDVTATVPSIPLITASILSKKLAEGIDSLVLDVKFGNGAFMKTIDDARALAQSLVGVGTQMGKKVTALLTDMNQPLGHTVGNALEVQESIETLQGNGPEDLIELTLQLAAHMLQLAGIHPDLDGCRSLAAEKLNNGSALEVWNEMVILHGGNPEAPLPVAAIRQELPARHSGYIESVDAEKIGRAAQLLGAGRAKTTDSIDLAAGISHIKKAGEKITADQSLCTLHTSDYDRLGAAVELLKTAFHISQTPPQQNALIREIISC